MLPVYYPTKEEKADARLYAENIRKKMADTLGCPIIEQGVADCTYL